LTTFIKNFFAKHIFICFAVFFLLFPSVLAAFDFDDLDLDSLNLDGLEIKESLYDAIGGDSSSSSSSSSSSLSGKTSALSSLASARPPLNSRVLPDVFSEAKVTQSDKRHVQVHMKLANRHFSRRNYERAKYEIDSVCSRVPNFSGARFMRAVIAAREKNYDEAWYNVEIAEQNPGANAGKIKDFKNALSSISSKPTSASWMRGVYNEMPKIASDRFADGLEYILMQTGTESVTSVEVVNSLREPNIYEVSFEGNAKIDGNRLKSLASEVFSSVSSFSSSDNKASMSIKITGLPLENSKPLPLPVTLYEFSARAAEDCDVMINSESSASKGGGKVANNYSVTVKYLNVLNKFLRKFSPYSYSYSINRVTADYLGIDTSMVVYKCDVTILMKQ